MILIEEALVSLVRNDGPVAALCGGRIRPELPADADQFPCIVYEKEDDDRSIAMNGPTALVHAMFRLEAWADTYAVCKDLRTRLRDLLQGFADKVVGVSVRLAILRDGSDLLEAAVGAERRRKRGVSLSLELWYWE